MKIHFNFCHCLRLLLGYYYEFHVSVAEYTITKSPISFYSYLPKIYLFQNFI